MRNWNPPSDWTVIRTIEAHTGGEPLRVIVEGIPPLPGRTILEKRRFFREHYDHLRTALMGEPRGHADMYGAVLIEPVTPDGDLGVIFMHNEGYSTMCGHGIIALAKVVLDLGIIRREEEEPVLRFDTPAGRVVARARRRDGLVAEVTFRNVPSFVYALDQRVEVPGVGPVRCDVAFGGAFYAFCRAEDLGLRLIPEEFRSLIELGMRIKHAVAAAIPIRHPETEELSFLYGTIFVGPAHVPGHHSRNVCIFADGQVDRSPTGTGVSARAALHYARGELGIGEPFTVESLIGTCFTGRIVEVVPYGPYEAVIPEITGSAHICGRSEWFIDPMDPLGAGFQLR